MKDFLFPWLSIGWIERWQRAVVKECDPNKDSLNLRPKQSVYNDPKHRCAALTAVTESVPNNAKGIWRFCSHIMEKPTTHRAVLIPHGRTHTSTPIIFHSPCLSFQPLCFFVWSCNLQSFSGHVFGHWAFFLSLSLSSLTWSFPQLLHRTLSRSLHFDLTSLPIFLTKDFSVLFSPLLLQSPSSFQSPHLFLSSPLLSSPLLSCPLLSLPSVTDTGCWGQWETQGHKETKDP